MEINRAKKLLMEKSPKQVHSFICDALDTLAENKITPVISNRTQVNCGDGTYTSGYFGLGQLAVATKKPFRDWFAIFMHEYCHFEQYLEDKKSFNGTNINSWRFFAWINGDINPRQKTVDRDIDVLRNLEFDCEKRVIQKIKKYGFENILEPKKYTKKANSYVNFYLFVAEQKKWYKKNQEPYSLQKVWKKQSDRMVMNKSLTDDMRKDFELCIKPKVKMG